MKGGLGYMQGWLSGESTRLPAMLPGFNSRTRRHMWVEFVVDSCLWSERFFPKVLGFPLSSKIVIKSNISKFQVRSGECIQLVLCVKYIDT